jgi:hypothetical protein
VSRSRRSRGGGDCGGSSVWRDNSVGARPGHVRISGSGPFFLNPEPCKRACASCSQNRALYNIPCIIHPGAHDLIPMRVTSSAFIQVSWLRSRSAYGVQVSLAGVALKASATADASLITDLRMQCTHDLPPGIIWYSVLCPAHAQCSFISVEFQHHPLARWTAKEVQQD